MDNFTVALTKEQWKLVERELYECASRYCYQASQEAVKAGSGVRQSQLSGSTSNIVMDLIEIGRIIRKTLYGTDA